MASSIIDRVYKIIEAASNSAKTSEGRSRIDTIQICTEGYAEPGYADPASGVTLCRYRTRAGGWPEAACYTRGAAGVPHRPCSVMDMGRVTGLADALIS